MTFDENTLRSVIEEVLKEMGEVSGTAAPAAAPVTVAAGKPQANTLQAGGTGKDAGAAPKEH